MPVRGSVGNYCFRRHIFPLQNSTLGFFGLGRVLSRHTHPMRAQAPGLCRAMPASSTVHVLQLLRELLAFVLLSYTVLIGALLLAGWTTYFLVLK